MLPDKLSAKNPVVPDNYLFAPDNVLDQPLIFKLARATTCMHIITRASYRG